MSDVLTNRKNESNSAEHWGVGCIILNNENKILCIQRSDNKQWTSPGGTVDPGETVIDAVIREIKEEAGVDIVNPSYTGMCYTQTEKNGQVIIWNSYAFVCRSFSGEVVIQPTEVLQYKWLSVDELDNYELFPPFVHSLNMLLENSNYYELLVQPEVINKMTALDQKTSIHNPGTNGANGHYDSSGNFVYDKKTDKKPAQSQQATSNVNSIAIVKESYVNYFTKTEDVKILYTVNKGQFTFPSYKQAVQDKICTNEVQYFKIFKEQYVLYEISKKGI